jgi:4'-phosphopantetheinyl transferase
VRAGRYYFARDRNHFTVARGLLRLILGGYLDSDPAALHFVYGTHGKPALAADNGGTLLRFNVSHSGGFALYAVAQQRELGVDIEQIRPEFAREQGIAERFFAPQEVATLRALPVDVQPEAFFACWSRKEAYIKARGLGLAMPLERFAVSLAPGEPAALLSTADDPQEARRWTMQALAPVPGYAAALAVAGHDWCLNCWRWAGTTP